ncbi:MAG TPA: hypothetical protein VN445_10015, partial [Rectinemataceae bacterium]|nr:hypothetical protein [Rectinemataceae bacterium]
MFHAKRPEEAAFRPLTLFKEFSPTTTSETPPRPPALALREIRKSFGPHPVLDNISLAVPAGRIFGIIGRSGAG